MTKDFWEGYVPEPVVKQSLTTEATLKLALEFVEANHSGGPDAFELIATIKQALAASVQPVAWMRNDGKRVTTATYRHNYPDYETRYSIPLYTTPPAAQRQWVGLTLADREKLRDQFEGWSYPAILVDAVSDILKEKNT
jgi:hypothetical protein